MDSLTLKCYNNNAAAFARDYDQWIPEHLYRVIANHFHSGGKTADIGCGNGRDTSYLHNQGYPVEGFDPAEEMIREAKLRYGNCCSFSYAALPGLNELPDMAFDNLLCAGVIMHLPHESINTACRNLMRIVKQNGIAVISFRESRMTKKREQDGRLFTLLTAQELENHFAQHRGALIARSDNTDKARPHINWTTLVIKKN